MKKEKLCGIYLWTNIFNNKKYVGCSIDIYNRWNEHSTHIKQGKKRKFYNAVRRFKIENFKKEIIELCDENYLKIREDYYIDFYDSIKNGYNVEKCYNTISNHPNKKQITKKISDKAKLKKWINNGKKNKTVSSEKLQKYLDIGWEFGRLMFTDDHIRNLSTGHIGIHLTEEAKRKCSWKDRHHSQGTKDAMSKKTKGRYTLKWYIEKYGEKEGIEKHNEHFKKANHSRGKIVVNNKIVNKQINSEELENYINLGWEKGRIKIKKIYINKNGKNKQILYDELENYLNLKWEKGHFSLKKIWITNGKNNIRIEEKEFEKYKEKNWKKGRIINKK